MNATAPGPGKSAPDVFDLLGSDVLDLGPRPVVAAEGMCHICGERAGKRMCRACERTTCASHLWTMFALCRACVPEDQMQRWHVRGDIDPENWLAGAKA